jgi:MinD-like ATPase involved in chromosome partitioning or flagellar assembly
MLRATFYSYKGGVGRTLSLLNVGAILGERGRSVVIVDLDLEAPGLGWDGPSRVPGVSDYVSAQRKGARVSVADLTYVLGPNLLSIPVGSEAHRLSHDLREIFADPNSDQAQVFDLFVSEIEQTYHPDFLLFDSRTGRSDIASVSALYLAQVLVILSGLNLQNIDGTAQAFRELSEHPARREEWLPILVLSPVPRAEDLGLERRGVHSVASWASVTAFEGANIRNELERAFVRALTGLQMVGRDFERGHPYFAAVHPTDAIRALEYDPRVPLLSEMDVHKLVPSLARSYAGLADVLERAARSPR